MRDVRHFVGRNHAVDNGRAVGLERLADGIAQLAGLFGLEAYPAAGARQRRIIRANSIENRTRCDRVSTIICLSPYPFGV